jgi:hypothetical protein
MSNQKNSKLAFVPSVNDQIDLLINTLQTVKSCTNEKGKREAFKWVIKTEARANKSHERKLKKNEKIIQQQEYEAEKIDVPDDVSQIIEDNITINYLVDESDSDDSSDGSSAPELKRINKKSTYQVELDEWEKERDEYHLKWIERVGLFDYVFEAEYIPEVVMKKYGKDINRIQNLIEDGKIDFKNKIWKSKSYSAKDYI